MHVNRPIYVSDLAYACSAGRERRENMRSGVSITDYAGHGQRRQRVFEAVRIALNSGPIAHDTMQDGVSLIGTSQDSEDGKEATDMIGHVLCSRRYRGQGAVE